MSLASTFNQHCLITLKILECSIDVRTDLNRTATGTVKEPLFLKYSGSEYKLIIPDSDGAINFRSGESALIACTSDQKPNSLTFSEFAKQFFCDVTPDFDLRFSIFCTFRRQTKLDGVLCSGERFQH